MSNPNRRGAMALVSASLCLTLAALFYFTARHRPSPPPPPSRSLRLRTGGYPSPQRGNPQWAMPLRRTWPNTAPTTWGIPAKRSSTSPLTADMRTAAQRPYWNALKKHNAPAAFFVVGHMIESAPDIVRRMAAEGHIVGNHTYHHPDMSSISDMAAFQKELTDLETLYQETTGQPLSKFYRPPQGKYSVENLKQAQQLGYTTVFWSLAYVDWNTDDQPSAEEAYAKLLPRIHDGAIVLLHSTSATNAAILDDLLTKWEEMGYTFASLDQLPGLA